MDKKIHRIDSDGFLLIGGDIYINENEKCPDGYTDILLDTTKIGYYKPRLINDVWVEGATSEEIQKILKNNNSLVILEERNRADIDYLSIMLGVEL